jgi:type IV pilus assembly protein PilQ
VIERRPRRWLTWVGAAGLRPAQVRGSLAGVLVSAAILPIAAVPWQEAIAGPGDLASAAASQPAGPLAQLAPQRGADQGGATLALTLRRQAGGVDVVIEGTGATPVLQQGRNGNSWVGQLTTSSSAVLRSGPQNLSLPEAGIQSISLQGSGTTYQVQVVPLPGLPLARPVIGADGRNLVISFSTVPQLSSQSARPDLRSPGTVPQATYAPALQPRAVAPPLGDMAVGSMVLRNRGFINLTGKPVDMTVRNAPAREVLMALAERGGYGFVFVNGSDKDGKPLDPASTQGAPVSISFHGEPFSRAFNSVLLSAGLQARLEGNLIVVGPNVMGQSFGTQLSKVYRLNQASASSAADYLASLGALITKISSQNYQTTTGVSQANQIAGSQSSVQTSSTDITSTQTYGAGVGPLVGLRGATDSRLQTITLVGDPLVIAVAENYLRQLDLRQRQVALSVRILDINLQNDLSISNSFAFRYGNNFIVNDNGRLIGAWGNQLPPTLAQFGTLSGGASGAKPVYRTNSLFEERITEAVLSPAPVNPSTAYGVDSFYNLLNAAITSSSTKLLASPTLILTDNPETITGGASAGVGSVESGGAILGQASIGRERANESFVQVGSQVIVSYSASNSGGSGSGSNVITCTPSFGTSGLIFGARVLKIDDNGYVTFNLSPAISATTSTQNVVGCGPINILSVRRLDTGSVRVRDGQTLILTGVISDLNAQASTKWPILGDLPLIGQFFRSSGSAREKRELVIMVTPRIINDSDGGSYGYGYQPASAESRQMMGSGQGGL